MTFITNHGHVELLRVHDIETFNCYGVELQVEEMVKENEIDRSVEINVDEYDVSYVARISVVNAVGIGEYSSKLQT